MRRYSPLRKVAAAAALLLLAVTVLGVGCGGSGETAAVSAEDAAGDETAVTTAASSAGESGNIVFSGSVDYAMTFTPLDMDYMEWRTVSADNPESGTTDYEGVLMSEVFSYVGVSVEATTLKMTASDGSSVEVALADIPSDALLAVTADGRLDAVMPGMAAEGWVQDLVAMELR